MVLKARMKDDPETGIPHYMGLTGKPLGLAVSVVATMGFLLFGYDQVSALHPQSGQQDVR